MVDTVFIVTPDENPAVLEPTLTDAIAAAQAFWLQSEINAASAQTSATSAANSAQAASESAAQASTAASAAVAAIAAAVIGQVSMGTATLATRGRLIRALKNAGALQVVTDFIMNNYSLTDDTQIEWLEDLYFPTNGLVYNAIKAAIPYSDAQATALWLAAFNLT